VGLAAVQIVRAMGAIPYGTSRTADKIERALPFGLERGAVVGGARALGRTCMSSRLATACSV
jgi:hypothetical protein